MNGKAVRHIIVGWIALALVFSSENYLSGQVRFREFRDDAKTFEKYLERAKLAQSEQEFESMMKNAHAFFVAEWERDAEWKIFNIIRKEGEGVRQSLLHQKNEARALWESEAQAAEARARGSWHARRIAIVHLPVDREFLKEMLADAYSATGGYVGRERLSRWEEIVISRESILRARWEETLSEVLTALRKRGEVLDEKSRGWFEKEVQIIENELRTKFRVEKNSLIYRERNKIIRDELLDLHSLRAASERGKASAIADEILARTQEALEKRKQEFLANPITNEGTKISGSQVQSDDWETQLRAMVETGLSIWRRAQEEFLSKMTSWKQSAENAYQEGDDAWRRAYEKLYRAQQEWQRDLMKEIDGGLDAWRKREKELLTEIERAKSDYEYYIETTEANWEEYADGVYESLLHEARMLGEAEESIDWLTEMAERYNREGIYTKQDALHSLIPVFYSRYKNRDKVFESVPKDAQLISIDVGKIRMSYDEKANVATESYVFTTRWEYYFFGQKRTYDLAIPYEYSITETSPQKTLYFYYMREATRWKKLREEIRDLISKAERSIHDATMLGIGGPGFLTNLAGYFALNNEDENDPYLMTTAELEYELARRERDWWAKRLEIAREVLDYATSEGPREQAELTAERKDEAKSAMDAARARYEESLQQVKHYIAQMELIKGKKPKADDAHAWQAYQQSIEYLSSKLQEKKWELEKAEEDYKVYANALIVLENNGDSSFVQRQLIEIQNSFFTAEKEYQQKFAHYVDLVRRAEGYERLNEYSQLISQAADEWMMCKKGYDAFSEIINGEVSDDTLFQWGHELFSDVNAAIWEKREAERESLRKAFRDYTIAPHDMEAKSKLIDALICEYLARKTRAATAEKILDALLDENFDPLKYVQNFEKENAQLKLPIEEDYTALQREVFDAIYKAFGEAEEKNFAAVIEKLPEIPAYSFGELNGDFVVASAAMWWTEKNLKNVNAENWNEHVEIVKSLRDENLLNEFFMFFESFQQRWTEVATPRQILKSLCEQHKKAFVYSDDLARAADFESALVAFVEEEFGNGFTLRTDFVGMMEQDFVKAARAMCDFIQNESKEKWYVSEALKELSLELLAAANKLDVLLYVKEHATDGNFREDFENKKSMFEKSQAAVLFVESAMEECIEYQKGTIDAINFWEGLGKLTKKLPKTAHEYLNGFEAYGNYLENQQVAKTAHKQFEIALLAREYIGEIPTIGLEEFIQLRCEGKEDGFIAQFRQYLESLGCTDGEFANEHAIIEAAVQAETDIYENLSGMESAARNAVGTIAQMFERVSQKHAEVNIEYEKARTLVEFHDNPRAFASYRNYVIGMWQGLDNAAMTIQTTNVHSRKYE
ncbi:MAG: hypothetical protein N2316_10635, partial [Spirochaetes bacterium]|nr:hypothetical protein [Spirochaetota bacterium]